MLWLWCGCTCHRLKEYAALVTFVSLYVLDLTLIGAMRSVLDGHVCLTLEGPQEWCNATGVSESDCPEKKQVLLAWPSQPCDTDTATTIRGWSRLMGVLLTLGAVLARTIVIWRYSIEAIKKIRKSPRTSHQKTQT
eukprot:3002795-Amphidinium_carterae.1